MMTVMVMMTEIMKMIVMMVVLMRRMQKNMRGLATVTKVIATRMTPPFVLKVLQSSFGSAPLLGKHLRIPHARHAA